MNNRRTWLIGLILAVFFSQALAGSPVGDVTGAKAAPPSSQSFDRTGTLSTTGQSMFGPGAAAGPQNQNFSLFHDSWNSSGGAGSTSHVDITFPDPTVEFCAGDPIPCIPDITHDDNHLGFTGDFGAQASGTTRGEIGMSITLKGFDSGSLGVDYPVTVHFTAPAPDTFAPGDVVTIGTSVTPNSGAAVHGQFPTLSGLGLNGTFGFHMDASGKLCFFDCIDGSIFDLSLPSSGTPVTGELFSFPVQGTGCFNLLVNFPLGFGTYPNQRCSNNGYIEKPNVALDSTLNADGSVSASGSDLYGVIPVSAVTWAGRLAGLGPVPLNFGPATVPGTSITAGWTSANLIFSALETMAQSFKFTPQVDVKLSWGQSLHFDVVDGNGSPVTSGVGTSATIHGGYKVKLTTPTTLAGPLQITPSLAMGGNTMTNLTKNTSAGSGEFKALSFTLDTPSATVDICCGIGTTTVWPGTSVNAGPVYDKLFPLGSADSTIANASFTVGGFNAPDMAPFSLVPDLPPAATVKTVTPVEGASFTGVMGSFSDPDAADAGKTASAEYSATINWGDGTAVTTGTIAGLNANFSVTGTHTFTEEGTFKVIVTVTDSDLPSVKSIANSTAVVSDAALHATGKTNTTTNTGQAVLLWPTPPGSGIVASFTDDDPLAELADFTATIDWGDGSTTAGSITQSGLTFLIAGTHSFTASGFHSVTIVAKDVGGAKATTSTTLLSFGFPPAGGSFAIGESRASLGTTVTFWGGDWAKANGFSNSVDAFKGFQSSSGVPACGSSWSSSVGNTAGAPASVAPFMAVVVTGTPSTSGPAITGNVKQVVVVQTNPGYGPAPGQAGIGTIIAVLCKQ